MRFIINFLKNDLFLKTPKKPVPDKEISEKEKEKYQEEFEHFQQELDKKKEEFQKDHPDLQGHPGKLWWSCLKSYGDTCVSAGTCIHLSLTLLLAHSK